MIHQNVRDAEQAERPAPSIYDSANVASIVHNVPWAPSQSVLEPGSRRPGRGDSGGLPPALFGLRPVPSLDSRLRRALVENSIGFRTGAQPVFVRALSRPSLGDCITCRWRGHDSWGRVHPDIFCKVRPSRPYNPDRRVNCACVETSDGREEQPVTSIMWGCGYRPA